MSVVHITEHDEVIYDVLKTRKIIRKKPPKYNNYLDATKNLNEGKRDHGTMGLAKIPPPDPKNFLKKHSRKDESIVKDMRTVSHYKFTGDSPYKTQKLPPHKKIDFIKRNALDIIKKKPVPIKQKIIDTRKGKSRLVENSGTEPKYIFSKTFGKPPGYLLKRVDFQKRIEQINKDVGELQTLPNCRYVTRQERNDLLNGLKQNWEEMQKQYQLLPIITDTIPKVLRKTKMEKDLLQLEKDICLIEKHPYIYVYDDE